MKKLRVLLSLSAIIFQGISFAADSYSGGNDIHNNAFVGSIYFRRSPSRPPLMPYGLSVHGDDSSLYVTAVGKLEEFKRVGRIWSASKTESKFGRRKVFSNPGEDYGQFLGHVFDPEDHNRLFVCSNFVRLTASDNQTSLFGGKEVVYPPTVIVFERDKDGDFHWRKVINFMDIKSGNQGLENLRCDRLLIKDGYLFALNSAGSEPYDPAIGYIELTDTDDLPNRLEIGATYGQFDIFSDGKGKSNSTPLLPDMAASIYEAEEEGEIDLFVLNGRFYSIDMAHFTEERPGVLKLAGPVTEKPLGSLILYPISLANYNDKLFIVGESATSCSHGEGNLYTVSYDDDKQSSTTTRIATTPRIPVSLAIGNDRIHGLGEDVVFVVMPFPVEGNKCRVDEYLFK